MSIKDVDDFFMPEKVHEPPPAEEGALVEEPPQKRNGYKRSALLDLASDSSLPCNIEAEKTILGAILLDNESLKEISLSIEADDFSLDSHRRICLRMKELYEAGRPIDIVTLSAELAKYKEIEAVGGVAYLASLTEGLPRHLVIDEYIRIVADKSIARRLMLINSTTIARAADQSESADVTLAA